MHGEYVDVISIIFRHCALYYDRDKLIFQYSYWQKLKAVFRYTDSRPLYVSNHLSTMYTRDQDGASPGGRWYPPCCEVCSDYSP